MPLRYQIEQAYAELERQRTALHDVKRELASASTSVTSKNRAVTVTVDSRGAVTTIKFNTGAYRAMAAAELAQLLVDTISAARDDAMRSTVERFRDFFPDGSPLKGIVDGEIDLDGMVEEALRAAKEEDGPR